MRDCRPSSWRVQVTLALLARYKEPIDRAIMDSLVYFGPSCSLTCAIGYALKNGGKRFRPAIVYMVADALGKQADVTEAALAIEFFHTASLIADDLPCMDDDDERREAPSLHKAYGEATALLASYALISAGFDFIAKAAKRRNRPDIGLAAVENASYNTGVRGAVGGQHADLFPSELSEEAVLEMIDKKTGTLFEISFVFGWLFGGGSIDRLEEVKCAARSFGRAFQLYDDLSDLEQDREGVNMAAIFGKERALSLLVQELSRYDRLIEQLHIASPELKALGKAISSYSAAEAASSFS